MAQSDEDLSSWRSALKGFALLPVFCLVPTIAALAVYGPVWLLMKLAELVAG